MVCFNSTQLTIKKKVQFFLWYVLLGNGQTNPTKNQCSTKQSRISISVPFGIDWLYIVWATRITAFPTNWGRTKFVTANNLCCWKQSNRTINCVCVFFSGGQCTAPFETVNVFAVDSEHKRTKRGSERAREENNHNKWYKMCGHKYLISLKSTQNQSRLIPQMSQSWVSPIFDK